MSLATVKAWFAEHAPEIEVIETEASSATVAEAAAALGLPPERIAKTLCLTAGNGPILIVAAGHARLDNRKFKDRFAAKPRMLDAEAVLEATSHPVGGVCPFGLPRPLPIHLDESLRDFPEIAPAAGSPNSAVRMTPARLAELTGGEWIDVCK